MSQKAGSTDADTLSSNDPLLEDFQRGQRSSKIKGAVALVGVAVTIVFLLIGFMQMGTV